MEIDNIIDKICETQKRGKELLAQAFLIGVGWGRREITDANSLSKAINRLIKDENLVNKAEMSVFYKDECYKKYVNSINYKLFAYTDQNLEQIDEQYDQEQEKQSQQFNNSQIKSKLQTSGQKTPKSQELKCEICKHVINDNNFEYAKLSCQHNFHLKCLCQNISKSGPQCPICKYQISKDQTIQIYEQLPFEYKSICPTVKCENTFIYHDQQIFDCKKCAKSWCLECKLPFIEQEEHQCRTDTDLFKMKLGDKFKYCESCKQSFLVKHNAKFRCNCNNGEQSIRVRIATFFRNPIQYIKG